MANYAQNRIKREGIKERVLSANGSADVTQQGFREEDVFNPYRFNFGDNDCFGTFLGLGAPTAAFPLEFTLSNYDVSTQQYVLDSEDTRSFLRINTNGAITLQIGNIINTWETPISEIVVGNPVSLRFERDNEQVNLFYNDGLGGTYTPSPNNPKTFDDSLFEIDTVSSRPELGYNFNASTRLVRDGKKTMTDNFTLTIVTARMNITLDWQPLFGSSTSSDDEQVLIREQGGQYRIWYEQEDGIHVTTWFLDFDEIDWYEENTFTFTRVVGDSITLHVNGVEWPIDTANGVISGFPFDVRQIGFTPWDSGTFLDGIIKSVVGEDEYGVGYDVQINTGTNSIIDGTDGVEWELLGYDPNQWLQLSNQYTGELSDLFMGAWHWSLGSKSDFLSQNTVLSEDYLESGRDIELDSSTFRGSDWVDLGNGSTIEHTEGSVITRYQFDGVDDYISIPIMYSTLPTEVSFTFEAIPELGDSDRHTAFGASGSIGVSISNGEWGVYAGTATLDGLPISTSDPYVADGNLHTVVFTLTSSFSSISSIGGSFTGGELWVGQLYDVTVSGFYNRSYPINDGWAANPTIQDTTSNQNGTAINFNEGNWVNSVSGSGASFQMEDLSSGIWIPDWANPIPSSGKNLQMDTPWGVVGVHSGTDSYIEATIEPNPNAVAGSFQCVIGGSSNLRLFQYITDTGSWSCRVAGYDSLDQLLRADISTPAPIPEGTNIHRLVFAANDAIWLVNGVEVGRGAWYTVNTSETFQPPCVGVGYCNIIGNRNNGAMNWYGSIENVRLVTGTSSGTTDRYYSLKNSAELEPTEWIDSISGVNATPNAIGAVKALNTERYPKLASTFETSDYDNMVANGGTVRVIERYPYLSGSGETNGFTALSWDRTWGTHTPEYHLYLNGIDANIQRPSFFNFGSTDALVFRAKCTIEDSPSLGNHFPILGCIAGNASDSMLGLIPFDAGSGQLYQLTMRNFGGYAGVETDYTLPSNLSEGSYEIGFDVDNLNTGTLQGRVWDLNQQGENLLTNTGFNNNVDGWITAFTNGVLTWQSEGFARITATNTLPTTCGIKYNDSTFLIDNLGSYTFSGLFRASSLNGFPAFELRRVSDDVVVHYEVATTPLAVDTWTNYEVVWTPDPTDRGEVVYINFLIEGVSVDDTYDFDDVHFSHDGLIYDESTVNFGGRLQGFQIIGYCKATDNGEFTEQYARGYIWDVYGLATSFEFNLPINEGVGVVIEDLVGVDWLANNTTNDDWRPTENIYGGIVLETVSVNATDIDLVLRADEEDKTHRILGYDNSNFSELLINYLPNTQSINVFLDNVLVPELSGQGFLCTDEAYVYDNALRTTCGDVAVVGASKEIKQLEYITFNGANEFTLTKSDFENNIIVHSTGLRPLTIIVPANQTIEYGSIVTFELERPNDVIVRRELDESEVLVNNLPQATLTNVQRGNIVCGNIPDVVDGYTAYFANGYETGTVT